MTIGQITAFDAGGISPAPELGEASDRLRQKIRALSAQNFFPPRPGGAAIIREHREMGENRAGKQGASGVPLFAGLQPSTAPAVRRPTIPSIQLGIEFAYIC